MRAAMRQLGSVPGTPAFEQRRSVTSVQVKRYWPTHSKLIAEAGAARDALKAHMPGGDFFVSTRKSVVITVGHFDRQRLSSQQSRKVALIALTFDSHSASPAPAACNTGSKTRNCSKPSSPGSLSGSGSWRVWTTTPQSYRPEKLFHQRFQANSDYRRLQVRLSA